MIDAFKIGMSISLANGVSAVLGVIQRDLFGLNKQVDMTTAGFTRMKFAAVSAMAAIAGAGIIKLAITPVMIGAKFNQQGALLHALGVSTANVNLAKGAAYSDAALVHGSTPTENLQMIRELRGILKNTNEAIAAAPGIIRDQVITGQYGNAGGKQMLAMLKAADVQGAFTTNGKMDVAKFNAAVDALTKAGMLSSGLMNAQLAYRAIRLAGPGAENMSMPAFIKADTEMLMGVGPAAGRGLQMAYKTFIGGQLTAASATEMEQNGLIAKSNVADDHGHFFLKKGAHFAGYADFLKKGMIYWLQHDAMPILAKHGIHGKAAVMAAFAALPVTLQRDLDFIITHPAQLRKFSAQYDKLHVAQASKALQDGSLPLNIKDLDAAWNGFMTALGSPAVPAAIAILKDLTSGILYLEKAAVAHPGAAKDIIEITGAFGALLLAGGSLGLASAALAGFAGPLGPLVAVAAAGAAAAEGMKKLDQILHGLFPSVFVDNKKGSNSFLDNLHKHPIQVPWWFPLPAGPGGRGRAPDLNLNHYAPGHRYGADPQDGDIHNQSWVPSRHGGARRQTVVYVQLDKKTIAKAVSEEQAHAIGQQSGAPTRFDSRMTASYPRDTIGV